jgi:dTDP-D-glucose 4,6-dehydratase
LHAKDTASAVITIINKGVQNEIYNISGNLELQNIRVVEKIIEEFNGDKDYAKYLKDMVRIGQDKRYSINDSKLKALGWQPKAEFDKELMEIVQYYKETFVW